jgi:hypothetical protein
MQRMARSRTDPRRPSHRLVAEVTEAGTQIKEEGIRLPDGADHMEYLVRAQHACV